MSYHPRSILAIDDSPFSRSLAVLPALKALKAAYPQTRLVVAASRATCEILAVTGLASLIDLGAIRSADRGRGFALASLMRLVRVARRESFDLMLDFSPGIETQIASRLIPHVRLVRPSKLRNLVDVFFAPRARPGRSGNHAADCKNVMGQLGLDLVESDSGVFVPVEGHKRFEELLARNGSRGGEPLVVLYGSSATAQHRSIVDCISEVAVRLANNFGTRIVAVDEPGSRTFTDRVASSLPSGSIKLASPRALEAASAIARASMVITDDAELVNLTSGFRTPMLEVRTGSLREHPPQTRGVAEPGNTLADDVFEAACRMLQGSRFPSLFQ
jgi:ADP-heptose:LPS heptosyltransferase